MKKLEIKQGYSSSRLRRIAKMLYVFDWAADLVVISNVVCIVILLNNSVPPQVSTALRFFWISACYSYSWSWVYVCTTERGFGGAQAIYSTSL